jgi:hypothetical protein
MIFFHRNYREQLINIHINNTQLMVRRELCTTEMWLWEDVKRMLVPFHWKWNGGPTKRWNCQICNKVARDKPQRKMMSKTI